MWILVLLSIKILNLKRNKIRILKINIYLILIKLKIKYILNKTKNKTWSFRMIFYSRMLKVTIYIRMTKKVKHILINPRHQMRNRIFIKMINNKIKIKMSMIKNNQFLFSKKFKYKIKIRMSIFKITKIKFQKKKINYVKNVELRYHIQK